LTDRMMLQSRLHTLSRWALPIAAAILGFVAGATDIRGYFRDATYIGASLQPLRIERVLEDIVDDEAIYGREQEPIVAPAAGSKARIEAWLASRLKLGVKVPDLTARGLEFLGSRLMAVQGRPLFMLIYVNDRDERIGIGIGPYKSQSATVLKSIEDDGVKAFGRLQDGFLYVIVGPAGYPQTQFLANELPALLLPR
jgi:anti-sigma factor RsiW